MEPFRSSINIMSGYQPGEQPPPDVKVIKLNTNENPYPPSPKVLQVLSELDGELLRRYPDPMAEGFCHSASMVLNVPRDWILAGNGSDDLLTMISRACIEPGRRVVYPAPTYTLYRVLTQIQAAEFVEVPYNENYELPLDQLVAANGELTLVASPNSPSGTSVPVAHLEALAKRLSGVLVIDEAYADFADDNALMLVKKHSNIIILRTFSKGYSLAGLRLGFGVANPALLSGLIKVKDSYNVDAVACAVGVAAIEDQSHKIANAEKIKASRDILASDLQQLNFRVWLSQANFLLVRPPLGNAEFLYQSLKAKGILVRYFKQPQLEDKLRITIGTPEQNQVLVGMLSDLCS